MDQLTEAHRRWLDGVIADLHRRFRGAFSLEMVEALVVDTFCRRAATATVPGWLVVGTERECLDRLEALAKAAPARGTAAVSLTL